MNQKTAKLIRKIFGANYAGEATGIYNSFSAPQRAYIKKRMKLYINTEDKESLLSGVGILSDVKLEE